MQNGATCECIHVMYHAAYAITKDSVFAGTKKVAHRARQKIVRTVDHFPRAARTWLEEGTPPLLLHPGTR